MEISPGPTDRRKRRPAGGKPRESIKSSRPDSIYGTAGRSFQARHRPGEQVLILTEADVLDGEDVVPGWTLSVCDLFADC